MKVVLVNLVCHLGSSGKICDELAKYVKKENGEELVCSIVGTFNNDYEYKY